MTRVGDFTCCAPMPSRYPRPITAAQERSRARWQWAQVGSAFIVGVLTAVIGIFVAVFF